MKFITTLISLSVWLPLHVLAAETQGKTAESCNPVVDMLFVLDGSSHVDRAGFMAQKLFIRDILRTHQAPKGAVRIGSMVCMNNTVSSTPFSASVDLHLESLDSARTSRQVSGSKTIHCLENINFKFKSEAREGVFRIAVLLRGGGQWMDSYTKRQSELFRQNRIVMVVVAVGMSDFKSLSALQLIASEEGTFFVVSKYRDLKKLANELARGSCKPITLNLSSESKFDVGTVKPAKKSYPPCVRKSARIFKRYIPGLGYIYGSCPVRQTLDMGTCSCN